MSETAQIQLRHLFKVFSGSTPESGKGFYWDGDIYWVTPEDVSSLSDGYKLFDTKRKITEDGYAHSGVKMVPENSIVLTKRAPIGLLAILGVEACSNQGCFLLVPKEEVVPEFYYYYLFANKGYLQILGRGSTFMELSQDDLKPFKVPHLTKKKQRSIAAFLDSETKRIDDLIKEKGNQLILLSEKRQSLITQAVTKGINPTAKPKGSRIDWLCEIPNNWNLKKVKYLTLKVGSGVTPKGGATVYQKTGVPLLRSQNIRFEGLDLEDVAFITEEIHESMAGSKVYAGDVLINITGASIGRCYFYSGEYGEANVNQHVCILRPNEEILTEYLYLLLSSNIGQSQVELHQVGGGREGLTFESLKSFVFPLPNIPEQQEILRHVKELSNEIHLLEESTKKSINLLKERRSALITAAVTGQLQIP